MKTPDQEVEIVIEFLLTALAKLEVAEASNNATMPLLYTRLLQLRDEAEGGWDDELADKAGRGVWASLALYCKALMLLPTPERRSE